MAGAFEAYSTTDDKSAPYFRAEAPGLSVDTVYSCSFRLVRGRAFVCVCVCVVVVCIDGWWWSLCILTNHKTTHQHPHTHRCSPTRAATRGATTTCPRS